MSKIALVQCNAGSDIAANQGQLQVLVANAVETGAQVILLPEMCLCMDGLQYAAIAADPSVILWFSNLARENGVWLMVGAVPQSSPDAEPRLRSSLLVFNDQGEQLARYDKIHLFDVSVEDGQGRYIESDRFAPGKEVVVVDTPVGRLGLSICYDLRFPEHFQALRDAGAEIIVVPAAFTYTTGEVHWQTLLRARAIEQQCYVVAANQCGWHDAKRQTWGHSQIIDPWGRVLVALQHEVDVAWAEVDQTLVADVRKRMPLRPK